MCINNTKQSQIMRCNLRITLVVIVPSLSMSNSTKASVISFTYSRLPCWGIPSEKIGQNIHPPKSRFFVINYQHWTSTSAFRPILAPLDHWRGLGGPRGVWGALQTPKMTLLLRGHFRPRNALFWVMTTCLTMFLRFWVKIGPSGPKKGRFWPK